MDEDEQDATTLTVTFDDLMSARDDGSMVVITGTDPDGGDRVCFAVTRRAASEISGWSENGSADVTVPSHSVMRRSAQAAP